MRTNIAADGGGSRLATALLMLATVLVGLMAGLFFAFDVSVMPGLARGDDRTYVTAMRNINAVIDGNALFGTVFVVALLAAAASAAVELRGGRRGVAVWAGAAAVLYLVVLVITFTVNIPLNNELAAAGDAARTAGFPIVDRFKGTWVATNIVRTVCSTAALVALVRALVQYGRATRR
ncbi:anthrone oxygenase family protein [Streptomyces vinaceus]|uniref:anthrone oxygenase family protein n=1 Tax=Streptomyces vinaceus TaxID=1960 RepID=UPI00380778B7